MTEKCTFLLPFSVHPNLPKTVHCQFLVTGDHPYYYLKKKAKQRGKKLKGHSGGGRFYNYVIYKCLKNLLLISRRGSTNLALMIYGQLNASNKLGWVFIGIPSQINTDLSISIYLRTPTFAQLEFIYCCDVVGYSIVNPSLFPNPSSKILNKVEI